MDVSKLAILPLWMIPFVFSLSLHEVCHAWVANRLGDNTSKFMGRITMNPAAHIDPVGTIFFPVFAFLTGFPFFLGWAKPVIINERNFRNPYRDAMFVAAAGPLSNLVLAFLFTLAAWLIHKVLGGGAATGWNQPLMMMAIFGIQWNVFLAIFNLIPIPPLDGGRVIRGLFPSLAPQLAQVERYGFLILLFLLFSPNFGMPNFFKLFLVPADLLINVLMSLI